MYDIINQYVLKKKGFIIIWMMKQARLQPKDARE
jgi:hypothetical protein